ncbi:MAG: glycosyltransferase, partial [bacterium]
SIPADRVIIVDNNSVDGSVDLIESKYPNIELIRESKNTGFAAANNHAIELIDDCDWVALINPDAIASSDWINLLKDAIVENPETQLFSCRLLDAKNGQLLDGTGDL